jgi:hypothetical protein
MRYWLLKLTIILYYVIAIAVALVAIFSLPMTGGTSLSLLLVSAGMITIAQLYSLLIDIEANTRGTYELLRGRLNRRNAPAPPPAERGWFTGGKPATTPSGPRPRDYFDPDAPRTRRPEDYRSRDPQSDPEDPFRRVRVYRKPMLTREAEESRLPKPRPPASRE